MGPGQGENRQSDPGKEAIPCGRPALLEANAQEVLARDSEVFTGMVGVEGPSSATPKSMQSAVKSHAFFLLLQRHWGSGLLPLVSVKTTGR